MMNPNGAIVGVEREPPGADEGEDDAAAVEGRDGEQVEDAEH